MKGKSQKEIKIKVKDCCRIAKVKISSDLVVNTNQCDLLSKKYNYGFLKLNSAKRNKMEFTGPKGISLYERLAYHRRLGKKVVLKADKRKISARPDLLRREVDILKELSHSYIPQVYDFFIEDETVYTVMDFIDGESLDKPLKRGERFPQSQVIKWAKQLLEALCYLHSPTHGDPPKGYVHSDIKPANIMRTPYNDICLIDFNIALALGEENVVGCSAGYASPEHYGLDYSSFGSATATIEDETVTLLDETQTLTLSNARSSSSVKKIVPDVRSDIYSVGATLYHLLSGQRPAKNAMEVAPLSDKEFSPQFVNIISKAMNLQVQVCKQSN